jgi:hypothetical protein
MDFNGKIDYSIACPGSEDKPIAPYFMLLEAKKGWDKAKSKDRWQLLAQMAFALETNRVHFAQPHIYGALTNAENWWFFKMTADKKWMCSDLLHFKDNWLQIVRILTSLVSNETPHA